MNRSLSVRIEQFKQLSHSLFQITLHMIIQDAKSGRLGTADIGSVNEGIVAENVSGAEIQVPRQRQTLPVKISVRAPDYSHGS